MYNIVVQIINKLREDLCPHIQIYYIIIQFILSYDRT